MADRIDTRILGALRCTDAVTGAALRHSVKITGAGVRLQRTRSGHYAIVAATGLETHIGVFDDPPGAPAAESLPFELSIEDPTGAYMPRLFGIALPRRWDPQNGLRDLMEPVEVPLAASAARPPAPAWANVLAIVNDTAGDPVRGALVQVFDSVPGGDRLAWGLTHARGEALVPVIGLRPFREIENDPLDEDDNEVVTAVTTVRVTVTASTSRAWPVNPETLAAGGPATRSAQIAAQAVRPGTTASAPLTLDFT